MIRVCIVGVGLIGGSLGRALRFVRIRGKRKYYVTGFGRSQNRLQRAKKMGAVDEFFLAPKSAVENADIVVFCLPVHRIVPAARSFLPFFKDHAILTDVGSVKQGIVQSMRSLLKKRSGLVFVGGHPIAGSEKRGIEFSKSKLFSGAPCVLVHDGGDKRALGKVRLMWSDVGARCVEMASSTHDQLLALTSHLPHLLAFSLVSMVSQKSQQYPILSFLSAGSFRDMTRIAGSDPDLWTGILELNRNELAKAHRLFHATLSDFLKSKGPSLTRKLKAVSLTRNQWSKK